MDEPSVKDEIITTKMRGSIGYLTFNNLSKHNALTQDGWQSVPSAVGELIESGARVLVVSGAGSSFCAGADISEFGKVRKNTETAMVYEQSNIDAFAALRDAPVPVIAKIRGWCLGGGFGLACACDLRVADDTARFSVPAARLGLAYPVAAMADIVNAVGAQNAKKLLFMARKYDTDTMLNWGFLSEVVPTEVLDQHVDEMASAIAQLAPLTHRATKASISAAWSGDTKQADALGQQTFTSKDYAEGRAAFLERREAKFNGQ